ncbi:hypothetical protein PDE_08769 [Penicillium oxalicum 114-2]|uniref:Uncharacterized protein n=1 Tax=Penicillium oxalicum (strain 114-2 / CGMCC 5302) TaxID=933388 RepID=S8BFD6_PENO1|nr:hypothetical protein PDE_08769 [Penicillium oxalicum 114-2]
MLGIHDLSFSLYQIITATWYQVLIQPRIAELHVFKDRGDESPTLFIFPSEIPHSPRPFTKPATGSLWTLGISQHRLQIHHGRTTQSDPLL